MTESQFPYRVQQYNLRLRVASRVARRGHPRPAPSERSEQAFPALRSSMTDAREGRDDSDRHLVEGSHCWALRLSFFSGTYH